jgi:hypothetical protein
MKDKLILLGVVAVAILGTGLLLETLGSGKLGALPQAFAKKVTSGYGV